MDRIDARELLTRLRGRTIETLTGRPNRILEVGNETVTVATKRSPNGQRVPIASVQDALDELVDAGEVTISVPSVGYRSAFIGAVLAQVPGIRIAGRVVKFTAPQGQDRER